MQKQGVIAVLFLFVVGFIFAAISLSMQTGQIVERRILTDQAADSASYAFASKSAQGLNFISANNLAIAGVSHMAGVMHLAADWGILIKALFRAKSVFSKGSPKMTKADEDSYQQVYNIVAPIVRLYFRAGTGLTRMNKVIRTSFPYLGLVDAIGTGAANAPSAVIIPFGAPTSQDIQPAGKSFMQRAKNALKKVITSTLPNYRGLNLINSDEAFCLAYYTAEKALGGDHNEIDNWLTGAAFGPFEAIGKVISLVIDMFGKIGIIGNFVGLKVGFSGCGFGETGKGISTQGSVDKALISNLILAILTGPMSGRPYKFPLEGGEAIVHPKKNADELAKELNDEYNTDCKAVSKGVVGQWRYNSVSAKPWFIETPVNPMQGMCVYPKSSDPKKTQKKYVRFDKNFSSGTAISPGENPSDNFDFLADYEVACYGTILFKWEVYSGPKGDTLPTIPYDENNPPPPVPAPESNTRVPKDDHKSDICPRFNAADSRLLDYPQPAEVPFGAPIVFNPASFKSFVNMSRSKPFLEPVINGLTVTDITKSPARWRGDDPRPGAFAEISEYLSCATGGHCPFDDNDGQGGYFKNVKGVKFYPKLDKMNWMCPISKKGDGSADNLRRIMKFDDPHDHSRWIHTVVYSESGGSNPTTIPSYVSRYIKIQEWHNKRVDELVNSMDCPNYELFASEDRANPSASNVKSESNSNDYCNANSHMCWQVAMQKVMGAALKKGQLSFMIPGPTTGVVKETPLEQSLHYAVVVINPLRVDNKTDIIGRNDGTALAHCPPNMQVEAKLEDNTTVEVCDIQPVVGYISRVISNNNTQQSLKSGENFGGGDVNLASGGAIKVAETDTFATNGFMAISQSSVRYEDTAGASPYTPAPDKHLPPSMEKTYQMFWPSWKPVIEPSRVMTKLLPDSIAPLLED